MHSFKISRFVFLSCFINLFSAWLAAGVWAEEMPFDGGWHFLRADASKAQTPAFDDHGWEKVMLPHTARVEALVAGKNSPQWQGICWYRKSFELPATAHDKVILLRFDGAMNAAEIWVNGRSAGKFQGGYLPYVMDISPLALPGQTNIVAVRLDNRDNPVTGPKPLADLDFNLYGGLYRRAHLIIKDQLHITDSILADKIAGGGVFITFPSVSKESATVKIQTHVRNDAAVPRAFVLKTTLLNAKGTRAGSTESGFTLAAGTDHEFTQQVPVAHPELWSPQSPSLYQVRSELIEQDKVLDSEENRIGIRHIEITKEGFFINGKKMFLRGCNRHQEYPYIGNALSDAAQYRDALKIKEAGFDYVRMSHYPQSPAFLDACDELGIVVMDSILGWQYFGKDPAFTGLKLQECRELIRRDRNHPCVILWEVSLNESDMPASFIQRAQAIAHEEYPGAQCFTAGWKRGYDVFIQARQHGGCVGITNQPCVISEYGDWEYYAQNAGLDQARWRDLQPAERSSRQLRGDGEIRLLQQALNFQEAHNDDLKTTAFADGIWVMFDYNRGYAPDLESSGVMDIFRLPKFSYWFFRSQRDPDELVAGEKTGPLVFIANDWTANSPLEVRLFSNCEEVGLYLNGKLIAKRHPDISRLTSHLKHAPFTFKLDRFEPGTLRAVGYIGGHTVVASERHTPGEISQLSLQWDEGGRPFARSGKDTVFVHAHLQDAAGVTMPIASAPVYFGVTGQTRTLGDNPISSEAGVATILVEGERATSGGAVYALCLLNEKDEVRILSAAAMPDGRKALDYEIHFTTDGSEPAASSPLYVKPVKNSPELRAAILVQGQVVAGTDSRARAISAAAAAESGETVTLQ